MSDLQPQNSPGVYKRLSFEVLGGDDSSRYVRTQKGIGREIITPRHSVPYSREGTRVHEYIDRNEVLGSVKTRDSIIRLIVFLYPVVALKRALLGYVNDNTAVQSLFQVDYLAASVAVSPEVYSNG